MKLLHRLPVCLIGFALVALIWFAILAVISGISGIPLDLSRSSLFLAMILVAFVLGFVVCEWTKRTSRPAGPGYEDPLDAEIGKALRGGG